MIRHARIAPWLLGSALLLGCSRGGRVEPGRGPAAPTSTAAAAAPASPARVNPDDVPRIEPEAARREVQAGRALLVCAYEDDARCRELKLEGSSSLHELEEKLPSLPRDQAIIFYCA